jgi:hypothetical protein
MCSNPRVRFLLACLLIHLRAGTIVQDETPAYPSVAVAFERPPDCCAGSQLAEHVGAQLNCC